MLFIYPAIFHKEEGNYWVEFPDLEGCQSYGEDIKETIKMAQEALELYIEVKLEAGNILPKPSDIEKLKLDDNSFSSFITCEVDEYLKSAKAVKKTLTIPEWLNVLAEKKGINFSQTLQNALLEKLEVGK